MHKLEEYMSLCRAITAKLRNITEYYTTILFLFHDEILLAASTYNDDDDCNVSVDDDNVVTLTLCDTIVIEFDRLHDETLLTKTLVQQDISRLLIEYELSDHEIGDILNDLDEHIDIFVNDWKNDPVALSYIRTYYEIVNDDNTLQIHINGEDIPILSHREKIQNVIRDMIYKSFTIDRSKNGYNPLFEHEVKLVLDHHKHDIDECVNLILDDETDNIDNLLASYIVCQHDMVRINKTVIQLV